MYIADEDFNVEDADFNVEDEDFLDSVRDNEDPSNFF